MKKTTFIALILTICWSGIGFSQKNITLEDIWKDYKFFSKSVPGFNFQQDGQHYTRLENGKIVQYDLGSGQQTAVLFDAAEVQGQAGFNGEVEGYEFSQDENKILIESESEAIYRHSTKANFFVYDRQSKQLSSVFSEGKHRYASFNPQGNKVAFVYENNLYYKDLKSGETRQITQDGATNKIIYGATDWVYEEEFGFAQAFFWSPDGESIAFYRFDESEVPQFTMTNYHDEMYPEYVTFKYPKVGEKNAEVSIYIHPLKLGKSIPVELGKEKDIYIPRIKWTTNSDLLCVYKLNRHQNDLELLLANTSNGNTQSLLREKNKYYIDYNVFDNLHFLENGKQFIWTSEQDGWHHIYLHDMSGKLVRQITKGEWEVSELYGVNEKDGRLYYQAAEKSPLERQVYSIALDGKDKQTLAGSTGWNSAQFSSTYDYYVINHSTANAPTTYTVFDKKGKLIRVIEDNSGMKAKQTEYGVQPVEFFTFKTGDGVDLNGWMIKPRDFKENRQYPVLMYVYGGPGSQEATDHWMGLNYWWFQMLAQKDYIIACVDNRGTGGRGEAFKKMTYQQLGHYETLDQIEAAKYLGSLAYVDDARIGIFGWSYGGYMSSLCLLKGADVFAAAIAVAPVTNWKWYDSIYTERYMRTYQENQEGYRNNSPIYFADRLKGSYLLIHGMGDDNVHFQHTVEMANALIAANKQFDTYFYPNRNHGIYGGNTRLHLYTKMTDFLLENIRPVVKMAKDANDGVQKDVVPKQQILRNKPLEKQQEIQKNKGPEKAKVLEKQ
ncbi:MAG TPA: S9 family peptidase [Saprospiraceae bacterium]|nr:S9 family peptidase [Saprospiraceae bacterium]HMQ82254.1 S9 family peptidase [Saprospiraceae bacterium]